MVEPQKLAETPSKQVSDWFLSKLGFYKPDILPETRNGRFQAGFHYSNKPHRM